MSRFKRPLAGLSRLTDHAGGAAIFAEIASYTSGSGSWTVPDNGVYRIVLVGGGGSGARGDGALYPGGGGGGYCEVVRSLRKGDVFSLSVGVGGAPSFTGNNGFNGTQTSFVSTSPSVSLAMYANGGSRGSFGSSSGAGGTASGGDVNVSGSPGGVTPNAGMFGPGGAAGSPMKASTTLAGGGGSGAQGTSVSGQQGPDYGDGGGASSTQSANVSSGAGRDGIIRIYRIA